jgi:hypothetical protein
MAAKVERVKNSKKKTTKHYKANTTKLKFNPAKKNLYVALLLLKFKDDL